VSQLDVAKEQIAYLNLWLGIMAVTDISLIGWSTKLAVTLCPLPPS
jgi:hypothetical protein